MVFGFYGQYGKQNSFFFEGKLALEPFFIRAIYEEVDHWFLIKTMEKQKRKKVFERKKRIIFGWKATTNLLVKV